MEREIKYNSRLKELLVKKNVSQAKLALDSRIPSAYISRIIRGKQIPTEWEIESIASVLEVKVEDIF